MRFVITKLWDLMKLVNYLIPLEFFKTYFFLVNFQFFFWILFNSQVVDCQKFRFCAKISILVKSVPVTLTLNCHFWAQLKISPKSLVVTKISNFDSQSEISNFHWNLNFYQNLKFWPKSPFLTKISSFGKIPNFD